MTMGVRWLNNGVPAKPYTPCCYIAYKVSGDDVPSSIDKCFELAAKEMESKEIKLVELFWQNEWIGTIWEFDPVIPPPPPLP